MAWGRPVLGQASKLEYVGPVGVHLTKPTPEKHQHRNQDDDLRQSAQQQHKARKGALQDFGQRQMFIPAQQNSSA